VTAPVPQTNFAPPAFHWSQVASADYQTYIQNLRAIGCPEDTIRDIIQARVAVAFADRERDLGGQTAPAQKTGPALTQRIQNLHQEQATLLASLLPDSMSPSSGHPAMTTNPGSTRGTSNPGSNSFSGNSAAGFPAGQPSPVNGNGTPTLGVGPSLDRMIQSSDRPSVLPAVMADPTAFPMNEVQSALQDKMAADFEATVGTNQNPNDPTYRRTWQTAQWLADQRYRALFGAQAFAAMQKNAYIQSLEAMQAVSP